MFISIRRSGIWNRFNLGSQPIELGNGQRSRPRASGFTLLELAITLGIVAILAAILTPFVATMMEDARVTRAEQEAQNLATAVLNFRQNTGRWPIFVAGTGISTSSATFTVLMGPGPDPDPPGSLWLPGLAARGDIDGILGRNTPGYTTTGRFRWRGPYATGVGTDPWGNAFILNAEALKFGPEQAAFVLSAGPNGTVETTFLQPLTTGSPAIVVGGDDIVGRVR